MDRSADTEGPVAVAIASREIPEPERRSVRRRLVQSTLFPHKSPEIESNGDDKNGDKECNDEDEDGQEEECSGSQSKKRRKRKGKTTPQSKTPTPRKSKGKSSANATPKKNGTSNEKAIPHSDASPPVPNLRLEAKLIAEENLRMFAGKQIHPFFSSWKVSKSSETTEAENGCSLVQRKYTSTTIGPIHVFEKDKDDTMSLDWRNWNFCEKFFANSSCSLEVSFSSNFEGPVEFLCFDKLTSLSHPSGTSLLKDNVCLDQCLFGQETLHKAPAMAPTMSSDAQLSSCQLVKDTETDCEVEEVGLSSGCVRKSYAEQQSEFPQERIMATHLGCANQIDDRLWIDKYQPKKAIEVCGNDESVKFLSEWLHTWRQGHQASKDSAGDECHMQDTDYNGWQSDSDSEHINGSPSLKNVLLITGPVGCGKSAAIYACAKEQGFKVLEANASECRNGAIMKQRFGEALQSHSLEWSQENPCELRNKHIMKFPTAIPNGKMTQDFDSAVIEVVPISDEDNTYGAAETSVKSVCKDGSIACDRSQLKALILFEDVDITFPDDRGFAAAIKQIADKAKGPVILTSNSDNPVLPDNLDRLEVCFTMPSQKELLRHVSMVCSAEKGNIQPHLIEQVVEYCQGDIRKTFMHLQFCCQNRQLQKGREVKRLSGPLLFDPEAGHRILPKMIPWGFPSQLSELVEKEITMSLSMMQEDSVFMEGIKDESDDKKMQNYLETHNYETDSVEAKKEAMLSRNCCNDDCNDFQAVFDEPCDFYNSPVTLVSFSQRKSRRKLGVVVSSDSEDEFVPATSDKDANNALFLEVDGGFPSCCPSLQNCLSPSSGMELCSEAEKLVENHYQCSEPAIHLHTRDTCKSADVSCVPESTFVPETEIDNGSAVLFSRTSCGQVADALEVSVSNGFKQTLSPVEAENLDKSTANLDIDRHLSRDTCDAIAVSSREEVEDSQNEHVEAAMREYQVMDECSRMDFNRKHKPLGEPRSCAGTDLVKKSWRKLRDHHANLRHFVTSEYEDSSRIIKLAYCMSNLISEVEQSLAKCHSLDFLELPSVLSEVSDDFGWCVEQLQMMSTMAQLGFSFYVKDIAAVGLKMGSEDRVDLTQEMMSTTSMMEVGSIAGQYMSSNNTSLTGLGTEMRLPESGTLLDSEMKSRLFDIVQSMVPSRSYMTMKGDAFYEYLSSLGHISRSEASRLSGVGKTKRRRGRAARNYLSSSLMLSHEEISLLGRSNIYGNISSQAPETNIK